MKLFFLKSVLPVTIIVEWSPCLYLNPQAFHLTSPPVLLRRRRELWGGRLAAGWGHPTHAHFLLTNPTAWAESSFLDCEEDLSNPVTYHSTRKHSPKGTGHCGTAGALVVREKMLPGVKWSLFFLSTLFLPSLIHIKATSFPGIWPVIIGKFLKAVEESPACWGKVPQWHQVWEGAHGQQEGPKFPHERHWHASEAVGAPAFQTGMVQLCDSEKCKIVLVAFHLGTGKTWRELNLLT